MLKYLAYIDESGDPIFKENASKIFFLGATTVQDENLESVSKNLDEVKRFLGLNELKSSKIRSEKRRIEILKELIKLDIKFFSIIVFKDKLEGDWFRYKETFYKFVQMKLNHLLRKNLGEVHIKLDKYGSKEYQISLIKYLGSSEQLPLFEPRISISSAKIEPLIQISDFVSGSLRKYYEGDFSSTEVYDIVSKIWSSQIKIPERGYLFDYEGLDLGKDGLTIFLEDVKQYLENQKKRNTPKLKTLEYLYYTVLNNPRSYIYKDEILDWLDTLGFNFSSDEEFRNKVISSLREDGVVISGTRKGYKIPVSKSDLSDYIEFSTTLTIPVLKRIKREVEMFSNRTANDTLKDSLPEELKRIFNTIT